jgi:hypothetical protein
MTEYTINPLTWFAGRETSFTPEHFTVAHEPLTPQSKQWIIDKLSGRYSIVQYIESETGITIFQSYSRLFGQPAFEDPKEAVLYELRWS